MKKLNLGCGRDLKKGWINLDFIKGDGVDVVHDLNQLPLPFEYKSFDFVLCKDVIEHVSFIPLINDIHRILKKGGVLKIRTPHFTSKLNFEDPTHKNRFSIRSFDYFIQNNNFSYERQVSYFSRINKSITFEKETKFLKLINVTLEKWVNKSEKHQNFYEGSFLRLFPALNIEITLIK